MIGKKPKFNELNRSDSIHENTYLLPVELKLKNTFIRRK